MKPLRVLLIEDSDLDAAHLTLELRRGGYQPVVRRVENAEEMQAALTGETYDVIVSDYSLPTFSAPQALAIFQATGRDIPFIVVSGAIGEETAVDLMRSGAHDYLLKDRLARLPAAIERETAQALQRSAKRRAETLFQDILRSSPLPAAIVDRSNGQLIDGSGSFARHFLEGEAFPTSRTLTGAIEFSQPERVLQLLACGSGVAWFTVYYEAGVSRVANIRCYSVEHEGAQYAYVVVEDVTEQHYLKAAFDAVANAVLIINSEHRLLYGNRSAEELFGSLYLGADVGALLASEKLGNAWWQQPTQRFEERRLEVGGKPYEASTVVFRFAGETQASTILTLRNVSEEEELLRLANHDALTGIHNVRYLNAVLPEQIQAVSDGTEGALAMIDLDFFKPINDELGHAAGDTALITFTNIVRAELRGIDLFARIGGDEFAIVFPAIRFAEAESILERIYERMRRTPFRFDVHSQTLSASCGLAAIHAGDSPGELRERADQALYEAKRTGRGRFVAAL
jgi:diguanylate cyclase (GGDEF)-like protein